MLLMKRVQGSLLPRLSMMISILLFLSVFLLPSLPSTYSSPLPFQDPMSATPRTGPLSIGVVLAYYTELDGVIDEAELTKHYKAQPERYLTWASAGSATPTVTVFFHPLGIAERDGTACRPHPGLLFDEVDGFTSSAYQAKEFNILTTTGCSGSCASSASGIECTSFYDVDALRACDTASSTVLCQTTFIHEALHALGLGYHANGVQCSSVDLADEATTWRDCEFKEYGGVMVST